MRYTLAQLTQRGIGFTVHALHHSLVDPLVDALSAVTAALSA